MLRELRLASALSQEELAERSGLSVRAISDLERSRTSRPYRRTVGSLVAALELQGSRRDEFVRASRLSGAPGTNMARTDSRQPGLSRAVTAAPLIRPELPAALLAPVRFSLPPDTTAFAGRAGELGRIIATLAEAAGSNGAASRAVAIQAICGMPGVGKTALAVHAAHLLANRFPDRQLFVDLHGHMPGRDPVEPGDALADLLAAAGVDPRFLPASIEGRAALWRDKMAGQRALLVLDNAASSAQVAPLLPGSAGCLVLVTSRRHLADLPGVAAPVLLEVLPAEDAEGMFLLLAPRAATDQPAVAELTELAGYLPLAISLLARVYARHPKWTLADLAGETRAKLLTLTAEHHNVTAAFEVSWQQLAPDMQKFFAVLGLHPGTSMDAYSAAALAGAELHEAARRLDGLYAEGLLTETGHRRYSMHDLIRRYAADRAAETMAQHERDAAVARLLDYYQHAAACSEALLARQTRRMPAVRPWAVPELTDADQALAWARAERPALLACLDHVTAAGQLARIVALTAGIAQLLRRDGTCAEALTRHVAAARAARDLGDRTGQADALLNMGLVQQMTGDYRAAAEILAEALGIFRGLGDRAGQASALHTLGILRLLTSDYPAADESLAEALAIVGDLGDRLGQANVLIRLSDGRTLTGDYSAAAEYLAGALAIFTDLGDRHGQANVLLRLKEVRMSRGDYSGAAEDLAEALAIFTDLGDRLGQADTLFDLGDMGRETGDYAAATANLSGALAIYGDFGSRLGQANAMCVLGEVRLRSGDIPGAVTILTEALGFFRDAGQRLGEANTLCVLGEARLQTGDYSGSTQQLTDALAIYRAIGSRLEQSVALTRLGAREG